METIHVQLSDERIYFVVAEVFGQYNLLKFVDVFDDEFSASWTPINNSGEVLILNKT